ncbi:hypothetical protein I4000191A8_05240 [Clostridia bacterium i40-0019-1A8]
MPTQTKESLCGRETIERKIKGMNIFNRDSLRKKQGIPIAIKRIFVCIDANKGVSQKS